MQRIILSLLGLMMAAASAIAQPQPEAYRLYDAKGKPVDFGTMTDSLSKQNVVFVGEMHNCPVTHWLELKILQSLYSAKKDKVAVGMETLESDNQLIIDEYLDGVITSDRFENECRLWPNYSTDYEPLVEFANEHKLRVFATNVRAKAICQQREKQRLQHSGFSVGRGSPLYASAASETERQRADERGFRYDEHDEEKRTSRIHGAVAGS